MKQEVVILGGQTIDQKLRVWQVGAQASKFGFYKLIVCIIKKMSWCEIDMQKYMPLVKQNVMKFEVIILGGQRKEIRDGGEGVERGLRWKHKR